MSKRGTLEKLRRDQIGVQAKTISSSVGERNCSLRKSDG